MHSRNSTWCVLLLTAKLTFSCCVRCCCVNLCHSLSMLIASVLTQLSLNSLFISFPMYVFCCFSPTPPPLHPLFRCHICSHICISPPVCFLSVSQELILIIPYFAGVNAHSSTHHPCGYLVASCASWLRLSPTCPSFRAPASVSQSVLFPPSQQPAPVSHSSGLTL